MTDSPRGFSKRILWTSGYGRTTAGAKAAGKVRLEGKDYVMADGDVVEFRFNV